MLQYWRRAGHLPSFCVPTRGIWQLKSPHPREFAIQGKKMLMHGDQPRGEGDWNWLMHKWIHHGPVSNLLLLLTETKRRWLTKFIRSSWWLDSSGGTQWTLREMSPDGNRTKTCCIGQKDVKTALNWTRK